MVWPPPANPAYTTVDVLADELRTAMALVGAAKLSDLDPALVRDNAAVGALQRRNP